MRPIKLSLLFALLILCIASKAQNIATASLKWNSTSTFVVQTGETVDETTTIVTSGNHILWKTADGTIKNDFTILETNGVWNNVSTNGSVVYEVDQDGSRGTIQFIKNLEGIIVRINWKMDIDPQSYELIITNVELL